MLECASSFTVAISMRAAVSAVTPSHLPLMSHCRTTRPLAVYSTIVLTVLPSGLAWPYGPTPFWNPLKR
jgi:hypothetical protein